MIQFELLEKEIKESNTELTGIKKSHDLQIKEEEHLTLGY